MFYYNEFKIIHTKLAEQSESLNQINSTLKSIYGYMQSGCSPTVEYTEESPTCPKNNSDPELKTPEEAAIILGVSGSSIRALVKENKIPSFGLGNKSDPVMIDVKDSDVIKEVKNIRKYTPRKNAITEEEYLPIIKAALHYKVAESTLYNWIYREKLTPGIQFKKNEKTETMIIKKNCPIIRKMAKEIRKFHPNKNR